jgi:hypothetical protein
MNLIQKQAENYHMYNFSEGENHKVFIQGVRTELYEYRKDCLFKKHFRKNNQS